MPYATGEEWTKGVFMPSTPAATSDMLRLLREGRGVVVGRRAGIEEWLLAGGASVWTLHGGGMWGGAA